MSSPVMRTDLPAALPPVPAALVLIDVIQPFDFEGSEKLLRHARSAATRIATLKGRAKQAGIPVIYANDHFGAWQEDFSTLVARCLKPSSPGHAIAERLKPEPDDYYVLKPHLSAFYAAPLEALLGFFDVQTLVLTGFAGDACVLATALGAHMRGLELFVPPDCTASQSTDVNRRVLALMRRVCKADTTDSETLDLSTLLTPP
jgi:nicotinamidase-related amidase